MCRTEIMKQVNEGFESIIDQLKSKKAVDSDILALSEKLDLLLGRLLDDLHPKQKGKVT